MPRRKAKTKTARPRDAAGRFLSSKAIARRKAAALMRQRSAALLGEVVVQSYTKRSKEDPTQRQGYVFYRDARGRFVRADIAATQKGGPVPIIKAKGEFHKLERAKVERVRALPPGSSKVLSMDLHGQSIPGMIEDNAVSGRPTFIRWRGRVFRVPVEQAGRVSDLFRVLLGVYVEKTASFQDSPQLRVGLIDTAHGDVFDMDTVETMDEDLADELQGDEDVERSVHGFNRTMTTQLDKLTGSSHAKRTPKNSHRPRQRQRARSTPRVRRRKR